MKKYDVVVARYKENIDWLDQLDSERFNIRIYNKGTDDISREYTRLENYGNEAHTYINYIIENYDNLPEFVIFIQGHPFDHCVNVIEKILAHTNENLVVLSDYYLTEDISGWYEHQMKIPDNYPVTMLRDVARIILGDETPQKLQFGAGDQYILNSSLIRNRTKEFYQKILGMFRADYMLPWHLERLYLYIFKAI
jgi:hypothetical protein